MPPEQMHQNLVMQQMHGPPRGQPRLPDKQPFYPNQRSIRIPRHQPPNNQPMYSSPPEGHPMAVQMIGPPGTTQFMPPGQYPPFITQPVSVINVSYFYPYAQFMIYNHQQIPGEFFFLRQNLR